MNKDMFGQGGEQAPRDLKSTLSLGFIALILVGGSVYAGLVILPRWRTHQELIDQAQVAEEMVSSAATEQANAPAMLMGQLERMESSRADAATALLTEQQADQIVDNLFRYAAESNVQIIEFTSQGGAEETDTVGYSVLTFQVRAEGELMQLVDFLGRIKETSLPSVVLANIKTNPREELAELSFTLDLYVSPFAGQSAPEPEAPSDPNALDVAFGGLYAEQEAGKPVAAHTAAGMVAMLDGSGHVTWIEAVSGQAMGSVAALPGGRLADGHILTDGMLTLVALNDYATATRQSSNPPVIIAYDATFDELWRLPVPGAGSRAAVALTQAQAIIATGSDDFTGSFIESRDRLTGEARWRTDVEGLSFSRVVGDPLYIYALAESAQGERLILALRGEDGAEVRRWPADDSTAVEMLLPDLQQVYALSPSGITALEPGTGQTLWRVEVGIDLQVTVSVQTTTRIFFAPQLADQAGVAALNATDGTLAWHSLIERAPIAFALTEGTGLWVVTSDMDGSDMQLSLLDPVTGLEQSRVPLNPAVDAPPEVHKAGQTTVIVADALLSVAR